MIPDWHALQTNSDNLARLIKEKVNALLTDCVDMPEWLGLICICVLIILATEGLILFLVNYQSVGRKKNITNKRFKVTSSF